MSTDVTKNDFENAWFSNYVPQQTAGDAISQIKDYAYAAFDKLDKNGNGYIERDELEAWLKDASTPDREKSFITFLLNNQEAISASVHEGAGSGPKDGITRMDLDAYFKIILNLLQ